MDEGLCRCRHYGRHTVTPDAYLITLRKPGQTTTYASVADHERHDDVSDEVWAGRKVEPLYDLQAAKLIGLRQARDMFMVGSISYNLLTEVIEAVDNPEEEEPVQHEACPECPTGKLIAQMSGGVKCNKCAYWFCW